MKDKKFTVLCALGLVWFVMFIAMLAGAKIHPRVEVLVYVLCVGWFAYWTLSTVESYFRKETPPTAPTPTQEPTQPTQTNQQSNKHRNKYEQKSSQANR